MARVQRQPLSKRGEDAFVSAYGEEARTRRPFYNFGAGNWSHPLWRNIDIVHPKYPNNRPDVVYDALEGGSLPIPDGSAEIFYFSHVNEHLPDAVNAEIFSEVRRCLGPNGFVRIAYPDFDRAHHAYRTDDRSFFLENWNRGPKSRNSSVDIASLSTTQLFLKFFAARATEQSPRDGNAKWTDPEFERLIAERGAESAADHIARSLSLAVQKKAPGCHINWWNHAKMERFLMAAGFRRVVRSKRLESSCPALRDPTLFDKTVPHISGYVEAFLR